MTKLPALTSSVRLPVGISVIRTIDHAAWASMEASIYLPTGEIDKKRAIVWIVSLWERTKLPMEDREWLQADLEDGLRAGHFDLAIYAAQLARTGDEICDKALRRVGAKLQTLLLQRRELAPGHLQVIAYLQEKNAEVSPQRRPRGRPLFGNLVRDVRLCLCTHVICRELGVPPTRNRASRRSNSNPSAISLLMDALEHLKVKHLDEATVQNIWYGALGNRLRASGIIQ
jgi:hypothetical protein